MLSAWRPEMQLLETACAEPENPNDDDHCSFFVSEGSQN